MKKIIVVAAMAIASSNISAQKLFTLEDLNFGGKNYKEMTPKRLHTTWYGNQLTTYDAEHFYSIDKTSGERSVIDDPRTQAHHTRRWHSTIGVERAIAHLGLS